VFADILAFMKAAFWHFSFYTNAIRVWHHVLRNVRGAWSSLFEAFLAFLYIACSFNSDRAPTNAQQIDHAVKYIPKFT